MFASLFAAAMLFADPAQIDCPRTSMTAAERTAFDAFVNERGPATDPRRLPFERTVAECRARHGWSEEVAAFAWNWRLAESALGIIRQNVARRGLAVARVEPAILGDEALMRALGQFEMEQSTTDFVRRRDDLFGPWLRTVPAGERETALVELKDFIAMYGLEHGYRAAFAAQ